MAAINAVLVAKLQSNSRVYITGGPSFSGVTDYSFNGSQVIDRKYLVHVDLARIIHPLWAAVPKTA